MLSRLAVRRARNDAPTTIVRALRNGLTSVSLLALSFLVVLGSVLVPATAAAAAEPAAVRNVKSASTASVVPGETFNWEIEVGCSVLSDECVNAVLTDEVPAEFQVGAASEILLTPALPQSDYTATVTGQQVRIDFHEPLASPAGAHGLTNGTVTVTIPVTVRSGLDYTPTPRAVTNTSVMVADNAPAVTSQASVELTVPLSLAASASKSFSPASNVALGGVHTTLTLGGGNTSNAPVASLVIQDPIDPAAAGNIFATTVSLQAIDSVTWPAGATEATVSVWDSSLAIPGWVDAAPVAAGGTLALPAGVLPANTGGIRIVFSSGATPAIERDATASVDLDLVNRAGISAGAVPNTVRSTVARDALNASKDATATYTLIAASTAVTAGKTITPDRMSTVTFSGSDATHGTVTLTGGNGGTVDLVSLTIAEPSDPAAFNSATNPLSPAHQGGGLIFDGFGTVVWPAGATAASVEYFFADGSSETVNGSGPGLPAPVSTTRVTGLRVTFTGSITPGAMATVPFTIRSNPAQVSPDLMVHYVNTANVDGVDGYGNHAPTAQAQDTVDVYADQLTISGSKTLSYSQLLSTPGQSTTATLTTTIADYPQSTRIATRIEMIDPATETGLSDWYRYFDANQLEVTQVPGGATLTVEYRDAAGIYAPVPGLTPLGPGTHTVDIPAAAQGDIYGIRLVWESATGFQPGQTLVANLGFELRSTLRDSGDPLPNADLAGLANCAALVAIGGTAGDLMTSNRATPPCATVDLHLDPNGPGGGGGGGTTGDFIDKDFINTGNTSAQTIIKTRHSDQTRVRLSWSTGGYTEVNQMVIYDGPVDASGNPDPAAYEKGMFDAFNLASIPAIGASLDPHLTYDRVVVQFYARATGNWEEIAGYCTTAAPCNGSVPARTLNATQQERFTAVRFIVSERPGRTGVAPAPGSGVAMSVAHDRHIDLVFTLRNSLRSSPATPVVDGYQYNVPLGAPPAHSVISNGSHAEATFDAAVRTDRASDAIALQDPNLATAITKTWAGGNLPIPDATVSARPSGRVALVATNQTVGIVQSLTIQEPNTSASTPNDSPFEQFDLLRFDSVVHPVGATGLTITVTRTSGGPLVASGTPAAAWTTATGWSRADLADATGFEFVYTGEIRGVASGAPSGTSATVRFDLELRATTRTAGTPVVADTVHNSAQVVVSDQRFDPASPATAPTFIDTTLDGRASATKDLVASTIGVTTSKTFSPTAQREPVRTPILMSLTATPTGSERVQSITITDERASFWNAFDFQGPDPLHPLTLQAFAPDVPVGVLMMQTEVCVGDTWDAAAVQASPASGCEARGGHWVAGPWQTQAQARAGVLPAGVSAGDVTGVRFTLKRADDSQWENPHAPVITIPMLVQRRLDLRTGGPVPTSYLDNSPAPGETVRGQSTNGIHAEILGIWGKRATADNTSSYSYTHAPSSVEVLKTPTGVKAPGATFDYTLTMKNTGSWPIENPVITDYLPTDADGAMLVFEPDDPWQYEFALAGGAPAPATGTALPTGAFSPDSAGELAGSPIATVVQNGPGPERITFTFPAGTVLEVGQTYTVTIPMMFRPGLIDGAPVNNTFSIRGDRILDACTAPVGSTATYTAATRECSTGTQVRPAEQPALRAFISVMDVLDADFPVDQGYRDGMDATCAAAVDADGFSRLPCVPLTLPGQKEIWRLTAQNTGTTYMPRLVLATRLPEPGDHTILDGFARASAWPAGFADEISAALGVPGAVMYPYYTTDTTPCAGVLESPGNPAACGSDPATGWALWTPGTLPDPTVVTGLQFIVDFPVGSYLRPGKSITIDIVTRTAALSATPGADTTANNSLSASALSATAGPVPAGSGPAASLPQPLVGTPVTALDYSRVSVALATGSVRLQKTVTGPASGFVPDGQVFAGELVCTSLGETTTRPYTLTASRDDSTTPPTFTVPPVTITDLPGGASCTATETAASGQTTHSATTVIVDPLADPASLPTVALSNDYEFASIVVSKSVTSAATPVPTAFGFTVECEFLGVPVTLAPADASFTLDDGGSRTITGLPAYAQCVVTETDARSATATIVSAATDPTHGGSIALDNTARTATFSGLSPDAAGGDATNTVAFDNRFNADAVLVVTKELLGAGAPQFGSSQSFTVHWVCTFAATPPQSGDVVLAGATGWQATLPSIIEGSRCEFTEPDLLGADAVVITPNEGDPTLGVVIVPGTATPIVDITVTNWYLTGSLQVTKTFAGDAGAIVKFATDPVPAIEFEFTLACERDGVVVDIPGGPVRTVTAAAPVADYENIASGADCVLSETASGGASSWRVLDAAGDPVAGGAVTVTVDPTQLQVADQPQSPLEVENTFRFAEISASKLVRSSLTDAAGRPLDHGPFELELACTLDGRAIEAAEPNVRTIANGETVTWTELAEGAECEITETETGGASTTEYSLTSASGTPGLPAAGTVAVLAPLRSTADPVGNEVTFINSFSLANTGVELGGTVVMSALALLASGSLLFAWAFLRRRRSDAAPE